MTEQLLEPLQRVMGYADDRLVGTGRFNPDWDCGIILDYLGFVGRWLKWSPPLLPQLQRMPAGSTVVAARG